MPTREEILYFGAGPARLPTTVLSAASVSLLNHDSTGLGLVEHSHRSALSTGIIDSASRALRQLLSVPDDYSIIFMQGGGTTQFSSVVYNLLGYWVQRELEHSDQTTVRGRLDGAKIDYLVTGGWSHKASQEAARLLGEEMVNVAGGGDGNYGAIPEEWKLTSKDKNIFTYYCDNETVDGVEFPGVPTTLEDRLVACDMSSNILSRKVDVNKYALIFAGAQKNVGITGLTLVIIRNEILAHQPTSSTMRALGLPIPPIMMDYKTIAKNGSLYNTLPIFDVWIAGEVMRELLAAGGIDVQEEVSARKSSRLYAVLEASPHLFRVVPAVGARSRMNICCRIIGDGLESEFVALAEAQGMTGLKGHRSVGGIRISNYNSISEEAVDKLVAFIKQFSKTHSA